MLALRADGFGKQGGDGFLVMRRLKALYEFALMPIIVVSARDATATQEKALEAGAVAYFQKPVQDERPFALHPESLGKADAH
ncbi:MAG TPA: response regulator [Candidatus Sulfotelmatobacter sp.]